jgi:dolichol kinase
MNSKNYDNLSEKMINKKKIMFRIYLISLILISLSYLIYSSYNPKFLIGLIIFIPFYFLAFKQYLNYKEMKNILKLKELIKFALVYNLPSNHKD